MINAIFAMDEEDGIGNNGKLPWFDDDRIKEDDLPWFKMQTIEHIVVMGRGTWDSTDMPKPLPRRSNWVITSGSIEPALNGVNIYSGDPYELCLRLEKENKDKIIWVIGGAKLLMSMAGHFDRLYISHVYGDYSCDTKINFAKLTEGYKPIFKSSKFDLEHVIYARLSPVIKQDLI